ncbi:MAG TPA: O-antigen ligase domain-containing protein [Actinobacteria bacterium]|nr:O-antigen ligase domain-containing protein [Actinomycetota bacterium]
MLSGFTIVAPVYPSLAGIAQYLGATFPLDLKSLFSQAAYSTFGNPTFLGSFLALTVPISLYLSMDGQSAEDKLIGYMSLPIIIAGLFVTSSSGSALGAIIGAGVFFAGRFLRNNIEPSKYVVIAVIIIIVVSLVSAWAIAGENRAIQQRLWAWSTSFQVSIEHPVVGTGLENLQAGIGKLDIPPQKQSFAGTYQDAHNNWLNLAATAGWPAAILWAVFLISVFWDSFKSSFRRQKEYPVLLAGAAGIVGYLITVQFSPQDIGSLPLVWIYLGLAISITGHVKSTRFGILASRIATVFLIPVVGAVSWLAINSVVAETSLLKANSPPDIQAAIVSFEDAQSRQPWQSQYYVIEIFRLLPSLTMMDSPLGNELMEAARKGISINPSDPETRLALGHIYRKGASIQNDRRLYRRALSSYKQALSVDRYNQQAFRFIALTYHDLGEDNRSRSWIKRYNRVFPNDPDLDALEQQLSQ